MIVLLLLRALFRIKFLWQHLLWRALNYEHQAYLLNRHFVRSETGPVLRRYLQKHLLLSFCCGMLQSCLQEYWEYHCCHVTGKHMFSFGVTIDRNFNSSKSVSAEVLVPCLKAPRPKYSVLSVSSSFLLDLPVLLFASSSAKHWQYLFARGTEVSIVFRAALSSNYCEWLEQSYFIQPLF